jgi:hypothetical protein
VLRRLSVAWSVVALSGGSAHLASAQDSLSFSTLELSAGVSATSLPPPLAASWRVTPGVLFSVLSPYGVGALRLTVEAAHQQARVPPLPDYLTLFSSLEWGLSRRLIGPFHGVASAGLGGLWLHFEDVSNPSETELAMTGTLQVKTLLGGRWTLTAGTSARHILFSRPVTQRALFAQLGYRGSVPQAVQRRLAGSAPARPPEADTPDSDRGFGHAGAAAAPPRPVDALGVWLDAGELRDRGVRRLPEVLRALGWDRVTVDHRSIWALPSGLAPSFSTRSTLYVDDVPVPLPEFGGATLDLLPVSLEELDGVHGSWLPGLLAGRVVEGGALHFTTSAPALDGFGVFSAALAENATGDPGPFLYTDSTQGNVDKLGTGYVVGARWRAGALSGSVGLRSNSDLVTDPRLGGRTLSLTDPARAYPVIRTRAPWASARLETGGGRHDLRAGRSTRTDYLFLPALGFEVPTRVALTHVGAAGREAGPLGGVWGYAAHATWSDLAPLENHLGLAFDLRTRRSGVAASLTLGGTQDSVTAGVGVDEAQHASPMLSSPVAFRTGRAWLSGARSVERGAASAALELRTSDGHAGVLAAGSARFPLPGGGVLHADAWHVRALPSELEGFWGLHARGYRFLEVAEVDVLAGPFPPRRETGAQLRAAEVPLGSSLRITAFFRAGSTEGVIVERPSFRMGPRRPEHSAPLLVRATGRGTAVAGGAEARWRPARRFAADARYRWLRPVAGDPLLRQAWLTLPAHRLTTGGVWLPRPDLRIGVRVEAWSATRWPGYEGVGAGRLPGGVRLDVSAEKELWEERVHVHARLEDLLDRRVPLHPLGAAPGLSVMVGGSARLGR